MNTFFWTCPYCEHKNKTRSDKRRELLYCDNEEGGCDQLVVVDLIVMTSTKVRKVEGEAVIKQEVA